jgi:hypothetical protein
MMADSGVYEQLARRFAPEDHKLKNGLTYVDGEMVISRLNEELGLEGWSFEVKDVKILENEVWALGRMTVYGQERTVVREQAGGQIINRKKSGEVIELANDIKGAITDCLKKCATLCGVGLYLFNPSERREVEQDMQQAKRQPQRPAAPPTPIREAAVLTGANPPSGRGYQCAECGNSIAAEATINIQKNKRGERVDVPVEEFKPVCEARLETFHCATCYDKKYWTAS